MARKPNELVLMGTSRLEPSRPWPYTFRVRIGYCLVNRDWIYQPTFLELRCSFKIKQKERDWRQGHNERKRQRNIQVQFRIQVSSSILRIEETVMQVSFETTIQAHL